MRRDLEGLGLTVGVLGLLLHLAVLRVLTAEKAQTAEVSSGARGHLLSKCLKWPHDPAPHREWKPAGLWNRQSPATMEQALSLEGLPGRTWFLSYRLQLAHPKMFSLGLKEISSSSLWENLGWQGDVLKYSLITPFPSQAM